MGTFEDIEIRLKEIFKVSKNIEIANILGVTASTYGNWKTRNTIPYKEIITMCDKNNIDMGLILGNKKSTHKTQNDINYKKILIELIEELNEKQIERQYHLIKAELLKD